MGIFLAGNSLKMRSSFCGDSEGAANVQRHPPVGCPEARRGKRIGLLGGSFDPPHAGHLAVSKLALRRLRLDAVWWLVSPGNPLKEMPSQDFATRLTAATLVASHSPHIFASSIEFRLPTRYTVDTLAGLSRLAAGTRFVWLMGADNLADIHRWKNWECLFMSMPVAAFARPGFQLHGGLSIAARRFSRARLPAARAGALALRKPPCWTLLPGPLFSESSRRIRQAEVL